MVNYFSNGPKVSARLIFQRPAARLNSGIGVCTASIGCFRSKELGRKMLGKKDTGHFLPSIFCPHGCRTMIDLSPAAGRCYFSVARLIVRNLHCDFECGFHMSSIIKLPLYLHATSPFWNLAARQEVLRSSHEKAQKTQRITHSMDRVVLSLCFLCCFVARKKSGFDRFVQ